MTITTLILGIVGFSDIYLIWKNNKLEKKAEQLSLEVVKLNSELHEEKMYSQQLLYKLNVSKLQTESLLNEKV